MKASVNGGSTVILYNYTAGIPNIKFSSWSNPNIEVVAGFSIIS